MQPPDRQKGMEEYELARCPVDRKVCVHVVTSPARRQAQILRASPRNVANREYPERFLSRLEQTTSTIGRHSPIALSLTIRTPLQSPRLSRESSERPG